MKWEEFDKYAVSPTPALAYVMELSETIPGISVEQAMCLYLKDKTKKSDLYPGDSSPAALAEFALKTPAIMQYLQSPKTCKKINAIKELRSLTYVGLKEAKEGIEYLCYDVLGWPKNALYY